MQPIDPYVDAPAPTASVMTAPSASSATVSAPITVAPSSQGSIDGPITMPSQLSAAPTAPASTAPRATGPITHPSQTDVRLASYPTVPAPTMTVPTGMFATSARVRRFDTLYSRYRGTIPLEYVRALVERESNGQPSVRTGSAIGLLQIVPVVLADYNKRHGTAYGSEHLTDPATNVAIGCELLRTIVTSYQKNHPRIRTLQPNWDSPEYVGLVTLGWNAGYSEAGGVGRVARYLEGLGAVDITIDQVSVHAKPAGATKHLANAAKVSWCKSVVALYQRERALRLASASTTSPLV
jgi:soluble lytic murein transglycosylase-like protein